MHSASFNACLAKGHQHIRHSPNGFDVIHECAECCQAWQVQGITGNITRLFGSYELQLTRQKLARQSPSVPCVPSVPVL